MQMQAEAGSVLWFHLIDYPKQYKEEREFTTVRTRTVKKYTLELCYLVALKNIKTSVFFMLSKCPQILYIFKEMSEFVL